MSSPLTVTANNPVFFMKIPQMLLQIFRNHIIMLYRLYQSLSNNIEEEGALK